VYGIPTGADRDRKRLGVRVDVTKVAPAHALRVEGFHTRDDLTRRYAAERLREIQRDKTSGRPAAAMRYDITVPSGDQPLAMGISLNLSNGTEGVHRIRLTVTDYATGAQATVYRIVYIVDAPS
jgi:hypothetical protein